MKLANILAVPILFFAAIIVTSFPRPQPKRHAPIIIGETNSNANGYGTFNICIGNRAGEMITTQHHCIVIGDDINPTKSYEMVLGSKDHPIRCDITNDQWVNLHTNIIECLAKAFQGAFESHGEVRSYDAKPYRMIGVEAMRIEDEEKKKASGNPNTHIGPSEEDTKRFQKSLDNRALGYHENLDLGIPKGYMELGTPNIEMRSKHEPIVTSSNGEWIINFKDK